MSYKLSSPLNLERSFFEEAPSMYSWMRVIGSVWKILSRKVFNSNKLLFGQGAQDREDYSGECLLLVMF